MRGSAPVIQGQRGAFGGERVLRVLRPKFHQRPERNGVGIRALQRKGLLDRKRKIGIFRHERLEKFLIDGHDRHQAGHLHLAVLHREVFTGTDLLRFVRELLVVLLAFLRVGDVFHEGTLGIFMGQRGQAVTVLFRNVLEIHAVGETVLRDNDVALTVAGIIEQFGDPATIVRSTDINHSGTK